MNLHPALQLRQLLAAGLIVRAPGAYDALSARLISVLASRRST